MVQIYQNLKRYQKKINPGFSAAGKLHLTVIKHQ